MLDASCRYEGDTRQRRPELHRPRQRHRQQIRGEWRGWDWGCGRERPATRGNKLRSAVARRTTFSLLASNPTHPAIAPSSAAATPFGLSAQASHLMLSGVDSRDALHLLVCCKRWRFIADSELTWQMFSRQDYSMSSLLRSSLFRRNHHSDLSNVEQIPTT